MCDCGLGLGQLCGLAIGLISWLAKTIRGPRQVLEIHKFFRFPTSNIKRTTFQTKRFLLFCNFLLTSLSFLICITVKFLNWHFWWKCIAESGSRSFSCQFAAKAKEHCKFIKLKFIRIWLKQWLTTFVPRMILKTKKAGFSLKNPEHFEICLEINQISNWFCAKYFLMCREKPKVVQYWIQTSKLRDTCFGLQNNFACVLLKSNYLASEQGWVVRLVVGSKSRGWEHKRGFKT